MNNFNIIRILREINFKNVNPVYHAPLIFDINTQRYERRSGYVAWPGKTSDKEVKEKQKNRFRNAPYVAYPVK